MVQLERDLQGHLVQPFHGSFPLLILSPILLGAASEHPRGAELPAGLNPHHLRTLSLQMVHPRDVKEAWPQASRLEGLFN